MSNQYDKNRLNSGKPLTDNAEGNPEPRFKYPNGYFKDKKCKSCNKLFTPTNPCHSYCSSECKRNNSYYIRNYGITNIEFKALKEQQDFKCKICGSEGFTMGLKGHIEKLVIDHDHLTGEVRGLLCHNCNRGLGLFKEDTDVLLNAIAYLKGE